MRAQSSDPNLDYMSCNLYLFNKLKSRINTEKVLRFNTLSFVIGTNCMFINFNEHHLLE